MRIGLLSHTVDRLLSILLPALLLSVPQAGLADGATASAASTVVRTAGRVWLATATGQRLALPVGTDSRLSATAAVADGWLVAGIRGDGGLILLEVEPGRGAVDGDGPRTTPLATPALRSGRLRREPLPLVRDGRLAGLAWLEGGGERSLAVRYASWNGADWGPVERVSEPGPGSQLALSGTLLRDGSPLLVWSAFDGSDDEVVWSLRKGSRWSTPRRLGADNQVPDITPAVTAAGGGALAAWSRFAGRAYETVVARFADGRWSEPRPVGSLGSVYPRFEGPAAAGPPVLLLRTPRPRGWEVLELDPDGRPRRRAVAAVTDPQPPLLTARPAAGGGGGVELRWPGRGRSVFRPWENLP